MALTSSLSESNHNLKNPEAFANIITRDKAMFSVMRHVESIAASSEAVLITGETGVGKELIAQAIHALSDRKGRLVPVNVAGLDDNVFADTLFGHEKGAFTGADRRRKGQVHKAAGGTLFLDEIGDLSTASQVKLLRLLQEGEYLPLGFDDPQLSDCRILTATNADIWELQRGDKFRQDLNFRLRTHHINIPPLRERVDDIPPLVDYFLGNAAESLGKPIPEVPEELFKLLETYFFPGNVRELQAMVFDAISRHETGSLSLNVFQTHIAMACDNLADKRSEGMNNMPTLIFPEKLPTLKEANRMLVLEAMKRATGNQTTAASMLGISRQAIGKRLKNIQDS